MSTFETNGLVVEFTDNSGEVLKALQNAVERGLSACGERAVNYAHKDVPTDTGNLKNSITYAVDGNDCYIGTAVKYAIYVEFGTGVYAETGGRQTPWAYQDARGDWHWTSGQKPQPFLRPAASDHAGEYIEILKRSLQNA